MEIVFSAGADNKIRAWQLDRAQNQMTPAGEQDCGCQINCLQVLSAEVLHCEIAIDYEIKEKGNIYTENRQNL